MSDEDEEDYNGIPLDDLTHFKQRLSGKSEKNVSPAGSPVAIITHRESPTSRKKTNSRKLIE